MFNRGVSVIYKWFISIFVILAAILALNVGFHFFSLRYLEEEMLNHYESSTKLLQTTVDMRLAGMETIINELSIHPNHIRLMSNSGSEPTYRTDAFRLSRELQAYRTANPLIKDIFVHYPRSGQIVGSSGQFAAKSYFYLSDFSHYMTAKEWHIWIGEPESRRFNVILPADTRKDDRKGNGANDSGAYESGLMILKQSMPFGTNEPPKAVVIAVLNESEIARILESVKIRALPKLTLIAVPEGGVYSYYGDISLIDKVYSNDYLVTEIPSEFGHISYMVINKKSEVLKSSGIFWSITLAGLLACLALGGCLAYYISKKNNSKVATYIDTVINEKSVISDELEKQRMLVRRSVLAKMLKEGESDNAVERKAFEQLRRELPAGHMVAVIINREFPEDGIQADPERYELMMEHELCGVEGIAGYESCSIDGNLVIVLYVPGRFAMAEGREENAPDLVSTIHRLLHSFSDQFGGTWNAGIGGVYDLASMTLSYHEALEAMEYALESDEHSVFRYADIEKADLDAAPSFTSLLIKFSQFMKIKDYEQAEAAVLEICTKHLNSFDHPDLAGSRRHAYIQFMAEAAAAAGEQDARQALLAARSLKALKADSLAILSRLRAAKELEERSDTKRLTDRAKRMIDEHYADPNLSLDMIARQLNTNHTHLSKAFKRHNGHGISEYMNRVRIEAAKKLLDDPSLTLKEIARRVGYTSDINFIRVFKKYENVTPRNFTKS